MLDPYLVHDLQSLPFVNHGFIGRHSSLTRLLNSVPYVTAFTSQQVHGTAIYDAHKLPGHHEIQGYDAFVCNEPSVLLIVKMADCVPILLVDPVTRTIAAAHAGRKGTTQQISLKLVQHMLDSYNVKAQNIIASIGPSICVDCYQIDREKDLHYDLWENNKSQLEEAGVKAITISGLCTACNAHKRFFSYRRENSRSHNYAFIMLC